MVDYADSSQLNLWLFETTEELSSCRSKANQVARKYLIDRQERIRAAKEASAAKQAAAAAASASDGNKQTMPPPAPVPPPSIPLAEQFACGFSRRLKKGGGGGSNAETVESIQEAVSSTPMTEPLKGHAFLSPDEEAVLVSFYVSKLPTLIGPTAQIPRLRRESKVTATAAMLLRRFYLSNSVMLFDPKAIMVGAAFLSSKVEDATTDVRYLEEGTSVMNAPVTMSEIIPAEIALLQGTHFDLLCFHPYKAVLALTEDLRTYLKSDKGKALVQSDRPLSGQDLKPIYDTARMLLDDVIVSDIPLLYNPGQVGLAALMVAQERVQEQQKKQKEENGNDANNSLEPIPILDLQGYVRQRFEDEYDPTMEQKVQEICHMLRELKDGKHGCMNYGTDMSALKAIHKKLKKVRVWGQKDKDDKEKGSSSKKDGSSKKDKEKQKEKDKKAKKKQRESSGGKGVGKDGGGGKEVSASADGEEESAEPSAKKAKV